MRFLNIIIGLVILVCIILVSYSHTVLLFNSVGIVGWKGHLATIAVEATFILSCLNLVVARLKKYRPGFFAVAGFFYGSGLTAWSNISFSFEYGITGWILGAAIPVGLWIAEGIISHSLLKKPTNQNTDQPKVLNQPKVPDQTQVSDQPSDQTNQPNNHMVDQLDEKVVETNQTISQPTNQPVDSTNQMVEKTVVSVVNNQPSTKDSTSQPTKQPATTRPTNQNGSTNRKKSTNKLDEEERIKKAYFDYLEENGEPPTQRKWAEKAGVSRYKITKFIEKYGEPKKSA